MIILYGKNLEKRKEEKNYRVRPDGRVVVFINGGFVDAIFNGDAEPKMCVRISEKPEEQVTEAKSLFDHMVAQLVAKCENGQKMDSLLKYSEGIPGFVFELEEEVYGKKTNFKIEFLKAYEKVATNKILQIKDAKSAQAYINFVQENVSCFVQAYDEKRQNLNKVQGIFEKERNE